MTQTTPEALPITSAVVIGIGGSGIHTLGRLRRAVRDTSRPDRIAIDNVKFLGIDAVEQASQFPPLPPNAGLDMDEFLNIASKPMNAYEYVTKAWQHDEALRSTWDLTYTPPNQSLTDGLKRSRALGNLVYRAQATEVQAAVQRTLDAAVALNPDFYGVGQARPNSRIQVFLVASCVGGTGSSGFAHVLHAVHRAAQTTGVNVAVYPVLYLPDVFLGARMSGLNPLMEERAHKSNAYAFLAELDYVISEPGAFDDLLCPKDGMPTGVAPIDVIESAFLIDGRLTDGSTMKQTDAYDLVATGLYSLLMTEVGALLTVAGTNVDVKGFDALEPPQRTAYATLGSFRTVFPASTYRRFARARMRSYLVQDVLLDDGLATNQVELAAPIIKGLIESIGRASAEVEERARTLRSATMLGMTAAQAENQGDKDSQIASNTVQHMQTMQLRANQAAEELANVLPAGSRQAASRIRDEIDQVLIESGEGAKVLQYAVGKARQQLSAQASQLEDANLDARRTVNGLQQYDQPGALNEHLRKVQQASEKNFFIRGGELRDSLRGYTTAAQAFANNTIRSHVTEAQLVLIRAGEAELAIVEDALVTACKSFGDLRSEADTTWRSDTFEGKDAGAASLTALIPSDVLPEVEESLLATAIWERVLRQLEAEPELRRDANKAAGGRPWLRKFYQQWWSEGRGSNVRGLVAYGEGDTDAVAQARSADIMLKILNKSVDDLAQLSAVMPNDILAAAAMSDAVRAGDVFAEYGAAESTEAGEEVQRCRNALQETIKRSKNVALQIDRARVALQAGQTLPGPVLTAAATGQLKRDIDEMRLFGKTIDSGDPEQLVTVTVQVGFPISAVRGLDQWHEAFRRVTRDRALHLTQSFDPPPFLDRRTAQSVLLRPLVRRLYSEALVAELVAEGSVINRLCRHHPELADGLGLKSPMETRWQEGRQGVPEMVGRAFAIRDSLVVPNGTRQVVLGATARDIFDRLAGEASLQQSIEEVFDWLLNRARAAAAAGDNSLLTAIADNAEAYRTDNAQKAGSIPKENPSAENVRELHVRQEIDFAVGRLLDEVHQQPGPAEAPPTI